MTGMHLARCQTALVERASNIQWLSRAGMSSNNCAWRNRSMATGHPTGMGNSEDLKLRLQDLLSVPAYVHCVLSRHELSRNLLSLMEGPSHIDLRAIGIVASNKSLVGHPLAGRPTHPTHRRSMMRRRLMVRRTVMRRYVMSSGNQDLVLQGTVLRASVREVNASVGCVDFSRSQAALVVGAANKKRLPTGGCARLDRVWRNVSITARHPSKAMTSQDLKGEKDIEMNRNIS